MESLIIFSAERLHLVVVAIFLVYVCVSSQRIRLLFESVIALPIAFITGRILNMLIESPRPFVVEQIQPLVAHIPDNGFPSEHTLLVATLAFLIYSKNKNLGILILILAVIVGVGRVLANVHHGIDVLGGITIAAFSVYVAQKIVNKIVTSQSD